VLNLTAKVQRFYANKLFHPIIVNAQFARQDQLGRMRQLGVTVNWFVPHLYYWGEALCQRIPNPNGIYTDTPLASAKRTLGTISAHANSPTTAPNPLQMMQFMNTRDIQRWDSPPTKECINKFAANEQVALKDALKALTINAALLYGLEKEKGSIEPGKLADMTLLSADPLQSKNLLTIQVLGTIVRGVMHLQSAVPSIKETSKAVSP
ncbi:amidohydrolase family protein, partial [Legionella tunisiensis]|uniref:amidohydrolase family protein n=1 Tax=Legionella tunisiensis TaxID=1034944 RepID=UPI000594B465